MKARQGKPSGTTLLRLDAERKRLGITLQAVADEAAKTSARGRCGVPTVSRVLHGHAKSTNVVTTLRRLIAEARAVQAA